MESIGDRAFSSNSLTSLTISNGVTSIHHHAFINNQLPDSDAFIYARKSDGTEDRTKIIGYGGARKDNVIIPDGVQVIGAYAFKNISLTSVVIPNSVITIERDAFADNSLTSVTIPNSVTTIGDLAFYGNKLNHHIK